MDHIWLDIFPTGPLEPERVVAALTVLREYDAKPLVDESGFHASLRDGTAFELKAPALFKDQIVFHGTIFPYGKVGRAFSDFLYDFASTIGCVIRLDRVPPVTFTPHLALAEEMPIELAGQLIRVSDCAAVFNALCQHYGMSNE